MKNGFNYANNLSGEEISKVKSLIDFYNKEKGITFKFDPGFLTNPDEEANHVLFYDKDVLVGYMSVDCYNGEDVEVAPVVDNEDIFLDMHQSLVLQVKAKGKKKLLYIVDRNFHFLGNCLRKINIEVDFSENRMDLNLIKFKPLETTSLEIHDATAEDKKDIYELDKDAFEHSTKIDEQLQIIENVDFLHTKIATINNEKIGKVKVFEDNGVVGVYGFVIFPHLRGKGFGKVFLSKIISDLLKSGTHQIYLEVETENIIAVYLYHSMGFEIQSTFDYYVSKI